MRGEEERKKRKPRREEGKKGDGVGVGEEAEG